MNQHESFGSSNKATLINTLIAFIISAIFLTGAYSSGDTSAQVIKGIAIIGFIVTVTIFASGKKKRVFIHDDFLCHRTLFKSKDLIYHDIDSVSLVRKGPGRRHSSRNVIFFSILDTSGVVMSIPTQIIYESHQKMRFLSLLKAKNPSIRFDDECRDIMSMDEDIIDIYNSQKRKVSKTVKVVVFGVLFVSATIPLFFYLLFEAITIWSNSK